MLDIKLIRENPEIVRGDLKKRGDAEKARLLEELIETDKRNRALITELNELRAKRNSISEEIRLLKAAGKDIKDKLREAADLPELVKAKEVEQRAAEERARWLLLRLPNILHESVPVGKDESENVEIRRWGKVPKFKFAPRDHIDLGLALGQLDIERAAKIAGARFYFMKGDLAKLNLALMRYAIDFMGKRGYLLMLPPYMISRKAYEGVTDLGDFEAVLYKVEGEDLHLIATSEHPLVAQFMDETLLKSELPLRLLGYSMNFRKEAGAHGKDTKGIFRVHQFKKVEQVAICLPEQSWQLHEELIRNAEDLFKSLKIPYRVVNICTGDIGTFAAKKYDLEAWLPAQNAYREMVSCSNVTDFQARRLNVRFRNKEGEAPAGFVHMLNSTVVTDRGVVAIVENFQQADGSVKIPKVLHPYTGFKELLPLKIPRSK